MSLDDLKFLSKSFKISLILEVISFSLALTILEFLPSFT